MRLAIHLGIVVVLNVFSYLFHIFSWKSKQTSLNAQQCHNTTPFAKPTILFWKQPFPGFQVTNPYWYIPINSDLPWNTFCPRDCDIKIGWNPDWITRAGAVVYHPDFKDGNGPSDNFLEISSKYRTPRQLYVFFLLESPKYHPVTPKPINYSKFKNVFNATMTYRTDSTFRQTYGSIGSLGNTAAGKFSERMIPDFKSKKFGAVAIITNCASEYRNELVIELNRLIKNGDGSPGLDLFGKCGATLTNRTQVEARQRAGTDKIFS